MIKRLYMLKMWLCRRLGLVIQPGDYDMIEYIYEFQDEHYLLHYISGTSWLDEYDCYWWEMEGVGKGLFRGWYAFELADANC